MLLMLGSWLYTIAKKKKEEKDTIAEINMHGARRGGVRNVKEGQAENKHFGGIIVLAVMAFCQMLVSNLMAGQKGTSYGS